MARKKNRGQRADQARLNTAGRFSSSGSLAIPSATFRASSLVIRPAAARPCRFICEIDIGDGEIVRVAEDAAMFLDGSRVRGSGARAWA